MDSLKKNRADCGRSRPDHFCQLNPRCFLIEPVLSDPGYIVGSGADTSSAGSSIDQRHGLHRTVRNIGSRTWKRVNGHRRDNPGHCS